MLPIKEELLVNGSRENLDFSIDNWGNKARIQDRRLPVARQVG
jgi:hypothetical protein